MRIYYISIFISYPISAQASYCQAQNKKAEVRLRAGMWLKGIYLP